MNTALQTSADPAAVEAPPFPGDSYDPARARQAARRLKGARWRRLVLFFSAIVVAGAAAGGFTLANRDALMAAMPPPASPAPVAVATPDASAPSLASASSRSVQLPGAASPDSDPNKVQARVVMPADPEPPAPAAVPVQMQDSQSPATPRSIPLGGGRFAAADETPALPAGALGFAPVPAPRPSSAP
ncbi:MAG: hypothetical protein JNK84_04610 [Phreatobacter sp.]|uniref:hypothetical protein n=1 Tax=Phreatobacter sp. TaxID=1966341 RepID=UPI001A468343|nr:hypothetical protein [Phreatobacter sp.]MBL8568346.1 hypothetical protein [Phreatobacter sp.]